MVHGKTLPSVRVPFTKTMEITKTTKTTQTATNKRADRAHANGVVL